MRRRLPPLCGKYKIISTLGPKIIGTIKMNDVLSLLQTPLEKAARWWGKNHKAGKQKETPRCFIWGTKCFLQRLQADIYCGWSFFPYTFINTYTQPRVHPTSMQIFKFHPEAALRARLVSSILFVFACDVKLSKISKQRCQPTFAH